MIKTVHFYVDIYNRSGRSEFTISLDFNERIPSSDALSTNSNTLNIGYLYLKDIYAKLNISDFF